MRPRRAEQATPRANARRLRARRARHVAPLRSRSPAAPRRAGRARRFPRLVELMQRLLAPDGCPWDREQTLRHAAPLRARGGVRGHRRHRRRRSRRAPRRARRSAAPGRLPGRARPRTRAPSGPTTWSPRSATSSCAATRTSSPTTPVETARRGAPELGAHQGRRAERRARSKKRGVLGGVPRSLPALTRAQRVGEKVARVGFDWPDARGSRAKVTEELGELDEAIAAATRIAIEAELGDVLFALVNLARHVDVDAEGALRRTIDKFTRPLRPRRGARPRDARRLADLDDRRQAHARGARRLLGRGQARRGDPVISFAA